MDLIKKDKQTLEALKKTITDAFNATIERINDPDIKDLLTKDRDGAIQGIESTASDLNNSCSSFSFVSLFLEEIPTDELASGNHVAYLPIIME